MGWAKKPPRFCRGPAGVVSKSATAEVASGTGVGPSSSQSIPPDRLFGAAGGLWRPVPNRVMLFRWIKPDRLVRDCEVTIETHRTPPLCRIFFWFFDCCFLYEFTIRF